MKSLALHSPLREIEGIGEAIQSKLEKAGIITIRDFLLTLPLRYEDRREIVTCDQLANSQTHDKTTVTLLVQPTSFSQQWRGRKSIQRAVVQDETGKIKATWFNAPFVGQSLSNKGRWFFLSGTWNQQYSTLQQATIESASSVEETVHTARLVPLYTSTTNISSGWMRRLLSKCLKRLEISESLPVVPKGHRLDLLKSLTQLHFPDSPEEVIAARERIALEELLSLMVRAKKLKQEWVDNTAQHTLNKVATKNRLEELLTTLPFELTKGQQEVLTDILTDLSGKTPMNRLLQGDVGSGKTVIALLAAQLLLAEGQTTCIVAPTRILAQQHFETIQTLFPKMTCELVLGGPKKKALHTKNLPQVYVGTHALINQLEQLAPTLIIFDEQQRFGVAQRNAQVVSPQQKGGNQPHILTMTATPIPRSLMLTVFSHLSLSVIAEMPKKRKQTITWYIPESKRQGAYTWLAESIKEPNTLALVVCPFIDPSTAESLENVAAAKDMYDKVIEQLPKNTRVALLHGKQKKDEQQSVIDAAFAGKLDVIVSTPIVEVGVDLPQATIMIIEAAERFGLSSLHQLRGRVGRRGQQGYCLVFSSSKDKNAKERLQLFSKTPEGHKIAELDLANRGAGNLFGVEQHGFDQLRFANWADTQLIAQAQKLFSQLPSTWESELFSIDLHPAVAAN